MKTEFVTSDELDTSKSVLAYDELKLHSERLTEIAKRFVDYYTQNGSHRLGNGQALRSYMEFRDALSEAAQ